MRRRWKYLVAGTMGLALLMSLLLVVVGMYTTKTTSDGAIYSVNRFTGRARLVGISREKREEDNNRREAEKRRQRVNRLCEVLQAAGNPYVAHEGTRTFHKVPVFYFETDCPLLSEIGSSTKGFHTFYEACRASYYPCLSCFTAFGGKVAPERITLYNYPGGPQAYTADRGEDVSVLGEHGNYLAVSSEFAASGKRTICWARRSDISFKQDPYTSQWWSDARRAQALWMQDGGTLAESENKIGVANGWSRAYVQRLLRADVCEDPTNPTLAN